MYGSRGNTQHRCVLMGSEAFPEIECRRGGVPHVVCLVKDHQVERRERIRPMPQVAKEPGLGRPLFIRFRGTFKLVELILR